MRGACYKAAVNASVDVAIVGGGFAGAATAWALARAGVRDVVVLERETELGRFASGRGAGLGRQLADDDDTTALTVRGAAVLRDELHDCWLASGGILTFDDPLLAELYAARAARFDVDVASLDRESIVQLWPLADRFDLACGLAVAGDGIIDIKRLLARYASSARIELGAEVVAVEPGAVVTSAGRIAAKVIVDASGAWAGRLTGDAPLDTFKRHLFVVEASLPGEPYLWHLGRREVYLRRGDGGGTLASACDAARVAPDDLAADPA